ncbi:MAG: CDP-alcohol phosphatidyltransferase family protein [Candidatus Thorarchaeota archaeon]
MSPSKYRLRKVFRRPILAVARPLASTNVSPNAITYLAVLVSLTAFLSLNLNGFQWLYGILVFLVGFLDGVDGAVARLEDRASTEGAFIDSVSDKLSEFIILLAIALAYPCKDLFSLYVPLWVLLCTASWLMTSYTRSRAEGLGVKDLDVGLGARSERLMILVIFSVLGLLLYGLIAVTLVGILTAAYRFYHYSAILETTSSAEDKSISTG